MAFPSSAPVRIAGVPEAFFDAFPSASFLSPTSFIPHPGGSGAMLQSLLSGSVDAAFLLTDCALCFVARGSPIRLLQPVVDSPLRWAVVARPGTAGLGALRTARWAVSRAGSGSDVLARVVAARRGWPPPATAPRGDLAGMLRALQQREADAFLWEAATTRGLLRGAGVQGVEIVDEVDAPWPAFCCAVRSDCDRVCEISQAVAAFLVAAEKFRKDSESVSAIGEKYGMAKEDAEKWLSAVRYAVPTARFEERVLRETFDALVAAGVVREGDKRFSMEEYVFGGEPL